MTEDIRPHEEYSNISSWKFEREMIERMTRVETQLENLTNSIEKFINQNDKKIQKLDNRVNTLEKLTDEATGAVKVLKIIIGVLSTVVLGLIGSLIKYMR